MMPGACTKARTPGKEGRRPRIGDFRMEKPVCLEPRPPNAGLPESHRFGGPSTSGRGVGTRGEDNDPRRRVAKVKGSNLVRRAENFELVLHEGSLPSMR